MSEQCLVIPMPRVFSTAGVHPYDQLEWDRRDVEITEDGGKVIFKQTGVEVPKSWSALAAKVAVSKYFYGDPTLGNDPRSGGRESSIRQLIGRVVDTIAEWAVADGYLADNVGKGVEFDESSPAEVFRQELKFLLVNQYVAFNSPVWFNCGLFHKYGIGAGGSKGNFVYDREQTAGLHKLGSVGAGSPKSAIPFTVPNWQKTAAQAPDQYSRPQLTACFIQGVEDTMEGIMELARSEAMLFKYGSGTGTDLSTLRSTREKLSGGGKPSGPMSFLKVYYAAAGVIKSGGKESVL